MSFITPDNWTPSPGIRLEGTALTIVKSTHSISVLAGPGAGKTELLAQRAAFLLMTGSSPHPRRILAITFKVDAARNLKIRVADRCDRQQIQRFESLTIDGFAKRIIDQFLESLPDNLRPSTDYSILIQNRDTWEEFGLRNADQCPAIRTKNNKQLNKIVHGRIPEFAIEGATNDEQLIRSLWWRDQITAVPSRLTYDMIKLLAIYILNNQPSILNAVRQTYSHVFLDEFQDVTGLQYELIRTTFRGSDSILTAVGDSNQAIMGWAGALPDIFERFQADFGATDERLLYNFRSNARVVELINDLASTFDDDFIPTECAREGDLVPENAVEGWVFETREIEGRFLAEFIANELHNNQELTPSDFVILARMRINDVEDRITEAFLASGLSVRNEAKAVGGIAIQDLVKEKSYLFFLSALKLAINAREGQPFRGCRDTFADIKGADLESDKGHSLVLHEIRTLDDALKKVISGRPPTNVSGQEIIDEILLHTERHEFQRTYKEYSIGNLLNSTIEGFIAFFDECRRNATNWVDCIANMEGANSVRLMTIHKCKGLEYNTVLFVEFNDDAFWGNDDDINVFFVALSRAEERVYFSFCRDAGGFANVRPIVDKLQAANVQLLQKP